MLFQSSIRLETNQALFTDRLIQKKTAEVAIKLKLAEVAIKRKLQSK
jgi:hypothetical protein